MPPQDMTLGIMQPYLFPYLVYFQLIKAVDNFVILDDVQYIKRGWINRNRILYNDQPHLFTFSIRKAPFDFNINQRYFSDNFIIEKNGFLKKIKYAYHTAPYYNKVSVLLANIFDYKEINVSLFITNSLKNICAYIQIETPLYLSSELNKNNDLKGKERVIEINKTMGASHYINPIGGTGLYSGTEFARHGIRLNFIKSNVIRYPQLNRDFIPDLSIIDVLMFSSQTLIQELLDEYELIE